MKVLIDLVEGAPATGCGDRGFDQPSHVEQRKWEGKRRGDGERKWWMGG
jgi:hypothetical protein